MTIETNITNRRELANGLAQYMNTRAVYLGPPTFAYAVHAEREGKWREPAMKVWNHLAWQDWGGFEATWASDAQWGYSLGRTAKHATCQTCAKQRALCSATSDGWYAG